METINSNILTEITTLTRAIEDDYPELQKYLDEGRSTLPKEDNDDGKVDTKALEDYRDSLKELIENYKNN